MNPPPPIYPPHPPSPPPSPAHPILNHPSFRCLWRRLYVISAPTAAALQPDRKQSGCKSSCAAVEVVCVGFNGSTVDPASQWQQGPFSSAARARRSTEVHSSRVCGVKKFLCWEPVTLAQVYFCLFSEEVVCADSSSTASLLASGTHMSPSLTAKTPKSSASEPC